MRRSLGLFFVVLAAPVLLLAQSGKLPTPESVLGFRPGADFKEANYEQAIDYFKKVDAVSDRMTMVEAGKTSQGRTYYFALISSKDNLGKIDRYREIARRLAHPEGLTDDDARKLAREGKAFVHIDGGLHATEIAGAQMTPQLLYDLLNNPDTPGNKEILDNVILMLWPTINPDGMSMVADWYMSHADPTGAGGPQPQMPQLYQDYVGHDNNRDAYMLNMIESRVMEHTWRQWEPDLVYVFHQAPPNPYRIWLPPFAEPIALHAPPIPSGEINMIGMAIAQGLAQHGQPGAVHMLSTYDAWYPGYIDYMQVFQNIPSFWTETAGASPTPSRVDVRPDLRQPKALYTDPFPGGEWHLRDAVEYDETAAMSTLEYAAKYKESLLYGRYQSGRDQIKQGRSEAPYGYAIPQAQRDPVAAVELLRRLAFSGVRVYQLTAGASLVEKRDGDKVSMMVCPAGTWVIPTDQEFAALARELLDVQKYPDVRSSPGGPVDLPYDAAGWTLPLQMGVTVNQIGDPIPTGVRLKMTLLGPMPDPKQKPVPYNLTASDDAAAFDSAPGIGFDSSPAAAAIVPPAGTITGSGPSLALSPAQNNTFRAINRAWKAGANVQYVPATGGGRYVINGLPEASQTSLVQSLALTAERVSAAVPGKRSRLGLVGSPTSMDDGWTRWVLEQYGFEYTRVTGADIQAGSLKNKFDALIFVDDARLTDAGGRGGGGRGGGGGGNAPAPAAGTDDRARALEDYVKAGGTIVCFNRSSMTIVDALHLPIKNATAGLTRQQFFVGGSLLNVTVDPSQRAMAGMPEQAAVFFDSGPVFDPQEGFKGTVLARYQPEGSPLASGYLFGEKYLLGKAAALDVELGDGHIILLGFRPQWRGQPFGTFRIIFNSALFAR